MAPFPGSPREGRHLVHRGMRQVPHRKESWVGACSRHRQPLARQWQEQGAGQRRAPHEREHTRGSSTMKLFSKAVIVAAVVALLLAPTAAFAQTKSAPGDPIGCPKGWVPVAPPVNPILRCLPGEIAAAVPTTPLATLDTRLLCPEG